METVNAIQGRSIFHSSLFTFHSINPLSDPVLIEYIDNSDNTPASADLQSVPANTRICHIVTLLEQSENMKTNQ
jgi:hypothetical protein